MATVTFLVHPERPDALELAVSTSEWLASRGDTSRLLQFSAPDEVTEAGAACHFNEVDLNDTTVAVSMGGDGTFLRVVRMAWTADVPVIGVNFGRVGYLPDL
ncbi:MAG TPA: NAD(+)/NADH kinase, partial [Acidimicrobiales bacterium]|nr:NAD(+)/NADH kinase [Acidimicrobiales bacterium]